MASWSLSWPATVCFHLGWQLGPESTGQSIRATQQNTGQNVLNSRDQHKWLWQTGEDETAVSSAVSSPTCVCVSCALWSLKCRFWDNNRMRPSHKMSQIIWLSHTAAAEICYCSSRRGNSSSSLQLSHPWMHWLYNPPISKPRDGFLTFTWGKMRP